MSGVTGQAQGSEPCSSAKSAPLYAATTPGRCSAGDTSTRVTLACAIGLRSTAMCSIPANWLLSVHCVCPVTSLASSLPSRRRPTSRAVSGAEIWSAASTATTPGSISDMCRPLRTGARHLRGRLLDGVHDVLVARAAAEVALDALPDLVLGRVRVVTQEVGGGHDHARRAVATLQRVALVERRLQRM